MVHVLGAVVRPGVVDLPEHARVIDALHAAGGLRSGADPGELNLAQILTDGQQIVIGTRHHPSGDVRDGSGQTPGTGTSATTASEGPPVNLNSATQAQLEQLPGVGPVTAEKMVAWRTEHGRFSRIEELQEVDGIGPKTYARLAPHVRV
jgi:competence protein ComEA